MMKTPHKVINIPDQTRDIPNGIILNNASGVKPFKISDAVAGPRAIWGGAAAAPTTIAPPTTGGRQRPGSRRRSTGRARSGGGKRSGRPGVDRTSILVSPARAS